MNDSLYEVLLHYHKFKESIPVKGIFDANMKFFVSQNGKPCVANTIHGWFRQLLLHSEFLNKRILTGPEYMILDTLQQYMLWKS
jgi:hypothetical protein